MIEKRQTLVKKQQLKGGRKSNNIINSNKEKNEFAPEQTHCMLAYFSVYIRHRPLTWTKHVLATDFVAYD